MSGKRTFRPPRTAAQPQSPILSAHTPDPEPTSAAAPVPSRRSTRKQREPTPPSLENPSSAPVTRGKGRNVNAPMPKCKRDEQEEDEKEDEEGCDKSKQLKQLEEKKKMADLEEKARVAEEEKKAAEERTDQLAHQLTAMQAMLETLQKQIQTSTQPTPPLQGLSSQSQSSTATYAPPSSPPLPSSNPAISPSKLWLTSVTDQQLQYSDDEEDDFDTTTIDPSLIILSSSGASLTAATANMMSFRGSSAVPTYAEPVRRTNYSAIRPVDQFSSRASTPLSTTSRQHQSRATPGYGYVGTPAPSDFSEGNLPEWSYASNHPSSSATVPSSSSVGKKKPRASRSIKEMLSPAQYQVYIAMEKKIWEVVLFAAPFLNTASNSAEMTEHFRDPWQGFAHSLNLRQPAPFDSNAIYSVSLPLSSLL